MKTGIKDWGVVQNLVVEADTKTALTAAIKIAMTEHRTVSHWSTKEGVIHLSWSEGTALPSKVIDPEKVTQLVLDWLLDNPPLGQRPDTDGSTLRGFRVTTGEFYDVCAIESIYIVYGK